MLFHVFAPMDVLTLHIVPLVDDQQQPKTPQNTLALALTHTRLS